MAFINKEEVQAIRLELKAKFPDFRFSVRKEHHMKVCVAIMSGPVDFTDILTNGEWVREYASVNHYHLNNYPAHQELLESMVEIIKCAPARAGFDEWFDKSDIMTDYFHTAYYYELAIGKWDKFYEYKGEEKIAA